MSRVAFLCTIPALVFGAYWLGTLLSDHDEPRPLPLEEHVYFGPSAMPTTPTHLIKDGN